MKFNGIDNINKVYIHICTTYKHSVYHKTIFSQNTTSITFSFKQSWKGTSDVKDVITSMHNQWERTGI